jgi:hypothetical protein
VLISKEKFNTEILQKLSPQICELFCSDEIDEAAGTRKMTKKVIEHFNKMNDDCNMTNVQKL